MRKLRINGLSNSRRLLLAVLLIMVSSVFNCASTQITEPLKQQEVKNSQTKQSIKDNPRLTNQEKEDYTGALDNTEKLAEKCDKQETEHLQEIESLKVYKHIVWGEVIAIGLSIIGGLIIWKLKS